MSLAPHGRITTRDCNPGIPNPGIPAVFANPESQDFNLNLGILGLPKLAKIVLFCMLNDRNKNFSHLVNKALEYYFVLSP